MNNHTPFHKGELKVQRLAGEAAIGQRNGSVIRNLIIPGAIPFIAQQNMVVVSSLDDNGKVWVSVLVGNTGFICAPDTRSMLIDKTQIISHFGDPLWENIKSNPQVGVLVIELSTRRRLRVNGRIQQLGGTNFEIVVEQAFPNCPKYIQRRSINISDAETVKQTAIPKFGTKLKPHQIELIRNADSIFVGSASLIETTDAVNNSNQITQHGGDASHRGGFPGFIDIKGQYLRIPDYKGNSMFNTLGNIEVYSFVGIAVIDFNRRTMLQLSGKARILWDQDDPKDKSSGTKRFWEMFVESWQETPMPETINWHFHDYSPHNPREKKLQETSLDSLILNVENVTVKSHHIKQFRLTAQDGNLLPACEPGAHLPLQLTLPTGDKIERCYSILSSSNENRFYEIAVRREPDGRGGSNFIHDHLRAGTLINAKLPRNEFPLFPLGQHTVLVAGGIGITPILSMVNELVHKKSSFEIHYSARTKQTMGFLDQVKDLAGDRARLYFSKEPGQKKLDLKVIMNSVNPNTHLFICGPVGMIEAARNLADELNWDPARIHFESFGASPSTKDRSIKVKLVKSGGTVKVKPTQSILDALIEANISVPYDCKRGECGMCATNVIKGEVEHRDVFLNKQERTQQMCICVSRAKGEALTLDI